jgi:RND family efflux transporter MFP subunit
MLKSKKFRIVVLVVIIVAVVYGLSKIGKKENYPLYEVRRGEFLIDVVADGLIEAGSSTMITSPSRIWGNVRIIRLVDEGTYVKPGDFLIQFDTAEFMERVENNENDLEKAKASYESEVANIEKTKADLESQLKIEEYSLEQTRLQEKNSKYEAENKRKEIEYTLKKAEISYNQLVDKINKNKEINKASLRQAELKVEQAEISLQRAKDDLAKLTITSPTEGLVVYQKIWGANGREKIKVGSSPWRSQPLMEIPDRSNMKVELNVNEVDISTLEKGQRVNIKVDALPEQIFTGEIINIASLAHEDEDSGKKVFEVEVRINELSEQLKPGMSSECQIIIAQMQDVVSIPIDAVTKKGTETGVYNANGKFVPVKTGRVSSDMIVIDDGLRGGDKIRLMKSSGTPVMNKPAGENRNRRKGPPPGGGHRVVIVG